MLEIWLGCLEVRGDIVVSAMGCAIADGFVVSCKFHKNSKLWKGFESCSLIATIAQPFDRHKFKKKTTTATTWTSPTGSLSMHTSSAAKINIVTCRNSMVATTVVLPICFARYWASSDVSTFDLPLSQYQKMNFAGRHCKQKAIAPLNSFVL